MIGHDLATHNKQMTIAALQSQYKDSQVVRSTGMNAESSRSHLLIYFFLTRKASAGTMVHSKLCLADLAGSERQNKSKTSSGTLAEGCAINKSLSALGNVLTALCETGGGSHVPFRDSKLTRLLQDCLVRYRVLSKTRRLQRQQCISDRRCHHINDSTFHSGIRRIASHTTPALSTRRPAMRL
jgi:Kinesin motor domain